MIPTKTHIDGGLSLSSISTDKFKSGVLTLSLCLPLTARDYLYSLLLSGVMRRGTQRYPSMAQINKHLDMLYATAVDIQTVIRGDVLCFTLSAEMLEPRFSLDGTDISDAVIATLADILFFPLKADGVFPEATLEAEKLFVRDMLAAEENDTATLAATRLKELLYRESATDFPTLSYLLSAISSVNTQELSKFHERVCRAPAKIFYVGSEAPEKIAASVTRHLGALNKSAFCAPMPIPHTPKAAVEACEERAVSQGKLSLGLRTALTMGDPQKSTAVMLNEIFGASPASKLFLGVRERLGLCYYCYSSYGPMTGNISVHSGIDVKNKHIALEAIMAAFEEIRNGHISDAEWSAAQKSLSHSYVQIYDSPFALTSFYLVRDLFCIEETVDLYRTSVLCVTRDEVSELANKTVYDTQFFLCGTLPAQAEVEYD